MEGETQRLACELADLRIAEIPFSVRHEARRLIVDTLGCAVAGRSTPIGEVATGMGRWYGTARQATVVGHCEQGTLLAAAYVNGRCANAMDFDETYPVGVHFGLGAVVAAIAVGEYRRISEDDLLAAVVAGYELGGRVAAMSGPMLRPGGDGEAGYPDVWGSAQSVVMAAVGAACRAFGLGPAATAQAYGIAAMHVPIPSGNRWSSAHTLPNCKYCDAGWATQVGVFAALAAQEGAESYPDFLDSDKGFAGMCGIDRPHMQHLARPVGEIWYLADITYKLWPSCRWTHYPLTALERLRDRLPDDPGRIDDVLVLTNPLAAGERFTKTTPETWVERGYSLPHVFAASLLGLPPSEWLTDATDADPGVRRLRERIRVRLHPESGRIADCVEDGILRRIPAGVELSIDGKRLEAHCDGALGDSWIPELRASDEQLLEKFACLCSPQCTDHAVRLLQNTADPDPAMLAAILATVARGTGFHSRELSGVN